MERSIGLERLTPESMSSSANQHHIVTQYIVSDIKRYMPLYAKGILLDIGCGNKPYEGIITPFIERYIGCDIIQSSSKVVDVLCPATDLGFADNSFDVVFSSQVIEHVADHNKMVEETFRVLKLGGYAVYTIPFCWELHEEPYDFFRISKYGIKDLFERKGFTIELIKANGGKWAAIFQLFLNVLFSARKYNTFRSKIIKLIFIKLNFITVYNKFAIWMDKKYFDDVLTLNYIVVVKK